VGEAGGAPDATETIWQRVEREDRERTKRDRPLYVALLVFNVLVLGPWLASDDASSTVQLWVLGYVVVATCGLIGVMWVHHRRLEAQRERNPGTASALPPREQPGAEETIWQRIEQADRRRGERMAPALWAFGAWTLLNFLVNGLLSRTDLEDEHPVLAWVLLAVDGVGLVVVCVLFVVVQRRSRR